MQSLKRCSEHSFYDMVIKRFKSSRIEIYSELSLTAQGPSSYAHLIELNCCYCYRSTEGLIPIELAVKAAKNFNQRRDFVAPSSTDQHVA